MTGKSPLSQHRRGVPCPATEVPRRIAMRTAVFMALICTTLAADVVVLKDGTRVGGKVVEKPQHWEVTTDAGLRTYLKEEVDKVVKDPKELMGDVDKILGEAKAEYGKALEMPEGTDRNALLRQTI